MSETRSINEAVAIRIEGDIGFLVGRNPPVNALSARVRAGLDEGLGILLADPAVTAIVLYGEGRTFFAGGDIGEFGGQLARPGLEEFVETLAVSPKPVVAAIHGFALGGGLELGLASDWRIATTDTRVGLPEINVGIIAAAGGVQRLARLIGPETTLEVILSSRHVPADEAFRLGIFDAVVDGDPAVAGAAFARTMLARRCSVVPVHAREDRVSATRADPTAFDAMARAMAAGWEDEEAVAANIEAVRRSFTLPFAEALAADHAAGEVLRAGAQSRALQYLFFAERAARKEPGARQDAIAEHMRTAGTDIPAMANAGARVLELGIASRASDIDVACVRALGWQRHRGGPMFQADEAGLEAVIAGLAGEPPSPILLAVAQRGGRLSEWQASA